MMNKNKGRLRRLFFFMVFFSPLIFLNCAYAMQYDQKKEINTNNQITIDMVQSQSGSPKKEGKWEVEIHYSYWTMDLIKELFEDRLTRELGKEIRKELRNQVLDSHPDLDDPNYDYEKHYEQTLSFDSGGSNYGLEIRLYPGGREGSFSLGFSFEKTTMRLSVEGPVKQKFSDDTYAEVESEGYLKLSPLSTNLSFRWDLKPSWRITPYLVVGLGVGYLKGEVGFDYSGTYQWAGPQEEIEDIDEKSLKEAEEDMDFNIPSIFFLLQMNIGLRGEIFPNLHLRAEAGFWDGFILRGGLAFRF